MLCSTKNSERRPMIAKMLEVERDEQRRHPGLAVDLDPELVAMELGRHGEEFLHAEDDRVARRVDRLLGQEQDLEAGEDEEHPEDHHDPLVLHQHRAERDEEGAEGDRAEDAVEQHLLLVLHRHGEIGEHRHEDEHVVDGERVLDDIARQELERGVAGELGVVHPQQVGALRQRMQQVLV